MRTPRAFSVRPTALIGVATFLVAACSSNSDKVSPNAIASVDVTPPSASLNVGTSLTLSTQVKTAQGTVLTGQTIIYTSSDTTKATVTSGGVVSAFGPGSVTITATDGTHSGQAHLTVDAIEDDWLTFGHDAHRTSAVWASVTGPLKLAWHYVPTGTATNPVIQVLYPLARTDLVTIRAELQTNYGYGITPGAERVSTSGQHVWTYAMGTDADFGNSSSLLGNYLIFNDDGVRYVDLGTGKSVHGGGVDSWGETLADSGILYLENSAQIDGPGVYIGAYDTAFKSQWTANKFATCRGSAAAIAGGLARNNGVIFYAPAYNKGTTTTALPYASGVYAFNDKTGAKLAFHASTPYSRISADAQNVYLVEGSNTLVARAQSDLHTVWSVPVTNPGEQAPVLADGLVIIATATDIEAHAVATGTVVWTQNITGADAHWSETYQGGSCGTIQIPTAGMSSATMVAALSSRTLIVTANDGMHVLSLATGADVWHGAISGTPAYWRAGNPIIVNDPVKGATIYVTDYQGLYALTQ